MARYRETFRRQHWLLLTLPIIVSVVFAGWFALRAAPKYRSMATRWIDNAPATGPSLHTMPATAAGDQAAGPAAGDQAAGPAAGDQAAGPAAGDQAAGPAAGDQAAGPATAEGLVLAQLLTDRKFDFEVSHDSLLPRFIGSGAGTGFSPTVLLKRDGGSPSYQAALSVATHVESKTRAPQLLQLTYAGPTPPVALSFLA